MHTPELRLSTFRKPLLPPFRAWAEPRSLSGRARAEEPERETVTILNPVEGGRTITSRKRAIYFTESGRANWHGKNAIRFADNDARNQDAADRAEARALPYRAVNRLMAEADLANVPVVMPGKLLGRGGRSARPQRFAVHESAPTPRLSHPVKFTSCPPVTIPDKDVRGMAETGRINRAPDGAPHSAKPADIELFPRVPARKPMDVTKLNNEESINA